MSLDWTIVEVTLGPDSERPVYRSWVLGVGVTRGQGLGHLPQPTEESKGKAYVEGNGKLGLRQRSRMTHEESKGKAYVEGQWEAGTRVYRLWKEARSRMTKKSKGKAYVEGQQ